MSDRSSVAYRIMGSRSTLLGAQDSLESITTTDLDNGALCYIAETDSHYSLNRLSTTPPSPPNVIKPAIGPGRWTVATGGTQGFQGAQGATGVQGAQGTQGAGFQGAQGATGTQGAQGSQGTQGAGFQGAQGAQGATGVQGSQGSNGAQGTTGAQGTQGAQGATGTQGAQGSQGSQGTGSQGNQGATGAQGPGGGAQGAQGATGTQGNQGSQGATGAGTQGAQGAQGGAGVQGSQGSQGAQGVSGSVGLQGLQGSAGAQGNQGSQGAQGVSGSIGLQGSTGAQGNQGFQGARGAQGFQGFQGSTGASGAQGFQGATGAGAQGAQGATGTQGSQGFQGAAGTGSQGAQGNQGATGTQGNQGFQGARGAQGFQGLQGATGTQGSQGFQGGLGAQGLTGAQGTQGFQGASGALFNPLTQFFYVDAANAGTQSGSIAQPYVSIAAALTARSSGNITLAVAPGTYATTIAATGNRNITIIGLCEPGQQTVLCSAVTLNHSGSTTFTLTLQNLSVSTITDSSTATVAQVIQLIDTVATGTITGNGVGLVNTIVRLSSVHAGLLLGFTGTVSMRVEAVTNVCLMTGENALIAGVFSTAVNTSTFSNCVFGVAPTSGPLVCYDTTFSAGFSLPSGNSYFYNCVIDGDLVQGGSASLFLWNCRMSTGSGVTNMAIGNFNRMEMRACKFGVKSTGHVTITGTTPNLYFDADSEKDFWKNGLGRISTAFSNGVFATLDAGEEKAQTMADASVNADPTVATRFVLPPGTALTASRNLNLAVAGAQGLLDYYVDNYGITAPGAVAVLWAADTLLTIDSSSRSPARFRFTVTDDGLTVVYNGMEYLG